MAHHNTSVNLDEKFVFSAEIKKKLFMLIGAGVILLLIGIFWAKNSGHHHEEHGASASHEAVSTATHEAATTGDHHEGTAHVEEGTHHEAAAHTEGTHQEAGEHHKEGGEHHGGHHKKPVWQLRLIKDLWQNNIFFAGIAAMGIFFVAFNYVAWAGWSAGIKRVPEAFGNYLYVAFPLTLVLFLVFGHDLFH